MMPDCDREGRGFLCYLHTHDRFFSCTPIISERSFFNPAVTSIADVRHSVMTLLWHLMTSLRFGDVNLNDGTRDVLTTSAYQTVRILDFYLTLGRITWVRLEFLSQG